MLRPACLGLVAVLAASPTFAQTAGDAPLGGPQVQGVCLLAQQAVFANAKVGVAASARLKVLADQAQAEVNTARAPIEADARTLEAQRASLTPAVAAQRQQDLANRLKVLQDLAARRSQQVERTRQKAVAQIAVFARPIITSVYKAHGCGLLLDRGAVLGGNMGGDLTAAVIQGLDAKITTITFDLEPAGQ